MREKRPGLCYARKLLIAMTFARRDALLPLDNPNTRLLIPPVPCCRRPSRRRPAVATLFRSRAAPFGGIPYFLSAAKLILLVDVRGDGPGAVFLQVFILHGFKSHILVTAHSA